ncbi:hypothetical protein C5S31_10250 [ANME-1 cluster archaeon GoMg2]|nr:hypothetical protein [ANME-1 cluster archaeon GoMg2]
MKTYERVQLASLIIGLFLCGISIILNQLMALQFGLLFVGISLLLFFFDINLRHRLKIYSLILDIKNPELRQQGYESLNQLEKSLTELTSGYFSMVNPFQARDIAFDFLKTAAENTEIWATQDFVSRPSLLEDERKRYFFSLNNAAVGRRAKVKRIFVVDNNTRNNPLFADYCNELLGAGCEVYHISGDIFYGIVDKDFMISMNKKAPQKSKVLIGGRDKPEDEYIARLSYRTEDIKKYQSKFDILLKSSEKF